MTKDEKGRKMVLIIFFEGLLGNNVLDIYRENSKKEIINKYITKTFNLQH